MCIIYKMWIKLINATKIFKYIRVIGQIMLMEKIARGIEQLWDMNRQRNRSLGTNSTVSTSICSFWYQWIRCYNSIDINDIIGFMITLWTEYRWVAHSNDDDVREEEAIKSDNLDQNESIEHPLKFCSTNKLPKRLWVHKWPASIILMIKLCAKYIRIGKKPFSSGCFLSFLSFADKSDAKCLKCKKAKIKRIVYLHLIKRLYFLGLLFVRHFRSYRFDDRSFTSFYYLSYICHANRTKLCRFCGHFRYFFFSRAIKFPFESHIHTRVLW